MFHPQQKRSAKRILREFQAQTVRFALLWAKCQSGKTGCYHFLIRRMLNKGIIQRAYIVCGSAETILRDQAHEDKRALNPDLADKIHIVFHQDFEKTEMDLTNALVVVDESHLVQTTGQRLHHFLGRHGITMDGNPTHLCAKNTFVLSVDATPYSELAALIRKETPFPKHVERLQPGEGYRGLAEFVGVLHPTFNIAENPERFMALLRPHKYVLIRLNDSREHQAAESTIRMFCDAVGYPTLSYLSGTHQVAITRREQLASSIPIPVCLEDMPELPTVVFLCGRLRAGKVVPKQHIGCIWEGAINSKTDTLVQGLVGRMCGYTDSELPLMFVPASFIQEFPTHTITESELERAIIAQTGKGAFLPSKATNLTKVRKMRAPSYDRTACVPLRIRWDGHQMDDLYDPTKSSRERLNMYRPEGIAMLRRAIHARIGTSDRYTPEQKAEIIENVESSVTPVHGRLFCADSDSSYVTYYKNVLAAHASGTTTIEHMAECPWVTILFTEHGFPGLSEPGASKRDLYAIFYTKAPGLSDRSDVPLPQRVAPTTGKSIFSLDTTSFAVPPAMGGVVGISRQDILDPAKLEAGLRDYLTLMASSSTLIASREWVPCAESTRLPIGRYHYKSPRDNDVEKMCRRLETEFGLKTKQIRVQYARSGTSHFNVKKIRW